MANVVQLVSLLLLDLLMLVMWWPSKDCVDAKCEENHLNHEKRDGGVVCEALVPCQPGYVEYSRFGSQRTGS